MPVVFVGRNLGSGVTNFSFFSVILLDLFLNLLQFGHAINQVCYVWAKSSSQFSYVDVLYIADQQRDETAMYEFMQEFNREFNTMGAKIGNADISHRIVSVKAELEKIREQVQNVE